MAGLKAPRCVVSSVIPTSDPLPNLRPHGSHSRSPVSNHVVSGSLEDGRCFRHIFGDLYALQRMLTRWIGSSATWPPPGPRRGYSPRCLTGDELGVVAGFGSARSRTTHVWNPQATCPPRPTPAGLCRRPVGSRCGVRSTGGHRHLDAHGLQTVSGGRVVVT